MRLTSDEFQVVNGFIGTLFGTGATAATAHGLPIDTMGFNDVMVFCSSGMVTGTGGAAVDTVFELQESATINGTAAAWTDIDNGAVNGTAKVTLSTVIGTTNIVAQSKMYERLDDTNRKRYIRLKASVYSTVPGMATMSAVVVLGNPQDTLYINQPDGVAATGTYAGNGFWLGDLYTTFSFNS